jgi:hypothetical protein
MCSDIKSHTELSGTKVLNFKEIEAQLLAEYNALRTEVIHRMGTRHQLVAFSVIVLGAVWAFAQPNTLLAYPILGFFLALGWAHNDFRVGEIGEYVRKNIEAKLPGLHWEQHFYDIKEKKRPLRYVFRASILSAGGIIVGTQILSLVVLLIKQPISEINIYLIAIDCVAIILTCIVLHWRKFLYKANNDIKNSKRSVLFIPNNELREHFRINSRQDVKIVTPAIMTESLAIKLNKRGKDVKEEEPLDGIHWRHASATEANKICESFDFIDGFKGVPESGPIAISFATNGSNESFHYHKKHWEIYFSEHKIGAKYKLPGRDQIETESMSDGGTIIFSPGIEHCMEINGLTIVLEVPAVEGDRESL